MDSLEERKKKRLLMLNHLYELSGGSERYTITWKELGEKLGFSKEEANDIKDYLKGEGLLKSVSIAQIAITHYGITQVEEALEHPNQATKYFPPVNIIHIESMNNSQIQQGTKDSTLTVNLSVDNTQALKMFVQQFKASMEQIPFSPEDKAEASAELVTIEAQLESPRPKAAVITESLKTLRNLLEGVAGNFIASGLMQQFHLFGQ